jgi:hypothetical protein
MILSTKRREELLKLKFVCSEVRNFFSQLSECVCKVWPCTKNWGAVSGPPSVRGFGKGGSAEGGPTSLGGPAASSNPQLTRPPPSPLPPPAILCVCRANKSTCRFPPTVFHLIRLWRAEVARQCIQLLHNPWWLRSVRLVIYSTYITISSSSCCKSHLSGHSPSCSYAGQDVVLVQLYAASASVVTRAKGQSHRNTLNTA